MDRCDVDKLLRVGDQMCSSILRALELVGFSVWKTTERTVTIQYKKIWKNVLKSWWLLAWLTYLAYSYAGSKMQITGGRNMLSERGDTQVFCTLSLGQCEWREQAMTGDSCDHFEASITVMHASSLHRDCCCVKVQSAFLQYRCNWVSSALRSYLIL